MLARTRTTLLPIDWVKKLVFFCRTVRANAFVIQYSTFAAKFGGATGNYNAHHVAYPQIDWRKFGTIIYLKRKSRVYITRFLLHKLNITTILQLF
jgi:hypothetical protein